MLKNLSLPIKVSIVFFPLFFAAVALISYINYTTTQEQMMMQVQEGAAAQANTIRESLVNMMITNERVDDGYLRKISTLGDIRDISILFRLDSLHFDDSRLEDDAFQTRLIRREAEVWHKHSGFNNDVFLTKTPQWFLICRKKIHKTKQIYDLSKDKPVFLQTCEEIQTLIPFIAEKKCISCHNVQIGNVLGAAVMTVPLEQTAIHLEENALRSLYVFIGFLALSFVLNGFVFRKFIANPLKKLTSVTETIGKGEQLDHALKNDFDNDEIGKLAGAFEQMQKNLQSVQNELVKSERLSAVGQMASSIVHDFRTPMTTLMLTIDQLKKEGTLTPEKRKLKFEQLQSSINSINGMIQELLDYTKGNFQLNYEECFITDFAELLQKEFELCFKNSSIRFTLRTECAGSMMVDKERMMRVLGNIINNAHDAMPEGGMISVIIEEKGGHIRFTVEDTGKGIPEEIRDTLFEPFVTSGKKKGTGLGLAIVRRVVELHQGTITFISEIGKGTEFIVTIPRTPAA